MRYLIPILLFLLLLSPAAAQEATPFPVLNAEDIFAEGVTVLERLPQIRLNNEAHELYYLAPDASDWEIYAYPDAIKKDLDYARRTVSGDYLFSEGVDWGISQTLTDAEWLFVPSIGLMLVEPQCGLERVNADIYDFWVLEQIENDSYRLCNTATGEQTPILDLPNFVTEEYCSYFTAQEEVNISPDGDWIVFVGCQDDWNLYAYHIPSQTVNFLGTVYRGIDSFLLIIDWYSDTELIVANPAHGSSVMASSSYYFMDLSQVNSIIDAGDSPFDETSKRYLGIIYMDYPLIRAVQAFNPENRETEILTEFECRIELCHQSHVAVSSDLRYVAVSEDVPFAMDAGMLFVYDRVQQQSVYEQHLTGLENLPDMFWTFDNHLVIGNWAEAQEETRDYITLSLFEYLELEPSFDLVIDNVDSLDFIVSPDNRFAFYHATDEAWMVYEFETEQSNPIFVPERCLNAWLEWKIDYIEVSCEGLQWRIRIDALSGDNS